MSRNWFGGAIACAVLGLFTQSTVAEAGYTDFAAISQPIGVACVGDGPGGISDKLVVTVYNQGAGVYLVDSTGAATWRAVSGLPTWASVEVYIAVSPGLGSWGTGTTYLIKGGEIYRLSADLSSATLFATIPSAPSTHSGITFDRTGAWGYDMIVSLNNGRVYRIDASGTVTYVASTNTQQEAPRVITNDPAKWGAYAGCITTSSESAHKVFAICPGGGVSTLASNLIYAESADLRPTAGETTFEDTDYVYFLSAFNLSRIVGYRASDLPANSEGDLFISREYSGGIYRVDGPGSASTFANPGSEHYEGSNFCFGAGTIDTAEDCSDGVDNDSDGLVDGNDPDCHVCGDGDIDPGEACDDGNVVNGDGCDESCAAEVTDTDGDGVDDDEDLCPGFDDNLDADADGDPDGCDDCPNDAANDADGDGVCGNVDICPGFDDTLDADGDGTPNGCDVCPNDAANDADGDGVCGDVDTCPGHDDSLDADGDGLANGCDACPNDAANDADGDGVCGDVDACPGYDDDLDADGDGLADGCDACPNDADNDADGDGVCGDVDSCPGYDDSFDADADGTPDDCDVCPNDADDDLDGDGVCGDVDECAGTVLPEQTVPSRGQLGTNRWADLDGDGIFDTRGSSGRGPGRAYTIDDTRGCSCEQIIQAYNLGSGHTQHGCSIEVDVVYDLGVPAEVGTWEGPALDLPPPGEGVLEALGRTIDGLSVDLRGGAVVSERMDALWGRAVPTLPPFGPVVLRSVTTRVSEQSASQRDADLLLGRVLYLQADYPLAVQGGSVLDASEFDEQVRLAQEARLVAARLDLPDALRADIDALGDLITGKVPVATLQEACGRVITGVRDALWLELAAPAPGGATRRRTDLRGALRGLPRRRGRGAAAGHVRLGATAHRAGPRRDRPGPEPPAGLPGGHAGDPRHGDGQQRRTVDGGGAVGGRLPCAAAGNARARGRGGRRGGDLRRTGDGDQRRAGPEGPRRGAGGASRCLAGPGLAQAAALALARCPRRRPTGDRKARLRGPLRWRRGLVGLPEVGCPARPAPRRWARRRPEARREAGRVLVIALRRTRRGSLMSAFGSRRLVMAVSLWSWRGCSVVAEPAPAPAPAAPRKGSGLSRIGGLKSAPWRAFASAGPLPTSPATGATLSPQSQRMDRPRCPPRRRACRPHSPKTLRCWRSASRLPRPPWGQSTRFG